MRKSPNGAYVVVQGEKRGTFSLASTMSWLIAAQRFVERAPKNAGDKLGGWT